MPKVKLVDLEPGSLVETPAVIISMGYKSPEAVFMGGGPGKPTFLLKPTNGKAEDGQQIGWWGFYDPRGNGSQIPAPEEIEVISNNKFRAEQKKAGLSGKWVYMAPGSSPSGCDPEIFVQGGNGKVLPARTFLASKKDCKSMFYDGVQAEIAPPAASCLEQLGSSVRRGLQGVLKMARQTDPKAKLIADSAIRLTRAEMEKLSDEDVQFRCSTSMNIYDDLGELPDARAYLWRFAGGHIHVGCNAKTAPVIKAMVRALDGVLGVAGVSLAAGMDNPERRRMYGRAGEFRLPKHGLEYRVLSNFWMCSPLVYHLVFELARGAYRFGESGLFGACWEGEQQEIRDCVNWGDVGQAREIIKRNLALYKAILTPVWEKADNKGFFLGKALETIQNGLGVVVKDPQDVEGNWKLSAEFDQSWGAYGSECVGSKWRNQIGIWKSKDNYSDPLPRVSGIAGNEPSGPPAQSTAGVQVR